MSDSNRLEYDREFDHMVESIDSNPKFKEVVRRKQNFSLLLLLLTLGLYIILILAVGFAPDLVGIPMAKGMKTTWGIPAGFFLIIWTTILTAFYIKRTNEVYDPMTEELLEEAANEILK